MPGRDLSCGRAYSSPCVAPPANRGQRLRLPAAEMLVELDDLGTLLKPEYDAEFARGAAAERDDLLDMIGHPGSPRVRRDPDMNRERAFADYRLVAAGYRDEILQVDPVRLAGRRPTLADDDDIESGAQGIASPVALRIDIAENAVERHPHRLARH